MRPTPLTLFGPASTRCAVRLRFLAPALVLACREDPADTPHERQTDTGEPVVDTSPTLVLGLTAESNPELVHQLILTVSMSRSVDLAVRCVADEDETERHVLASTAALDHRILVDGLLADTPYTCTLTTPDQVSVQVSHRTDPLPAEIPDWTLEADGLGSGRYILMNHGAAGTRPMKAMIIDPDGRPRWYHLLGGNPTDLDTQFLPPDQILYGGGYATRPTIVDLSRNPIYQGPGPEGGGVHHHHAERLPTGEILALVTEENEAGGVTWRGFGIEITDAAGQLTWSWNSQQAVDDGQLPFGDQNADAYHANWVGAVDDADGSAIYVNLRHRHRLMRIDKATGDVTWSAGWASDWTLVDEQGLPLPDEEWFYGAHGLDVKVEGDKVRVWFYDNGWTRQPAYSRALILVLDPANKVAQRVWSYTEPDWFEPIWGDVDPTPTGGVLITRGHGTTLPDTASRTQVVEVDAAGVPHWRLTFETNADGAYRSEAIDPCAIFRNARYCPSLADPSRRR